MLAPCLKCHTSDTAVIHHYDGRENVVFIKCRRCGEEGPHTTPHEHPDEHPEYTIARAQRGWNRENIPKSPGHLDEADPRYPGHVV